MAYRCSAGYDHWSAERNLLKPWSKERVKLDLNIAIPDGNYGRIVGCSGLACNSIFVHNGTIDSHYRGYMYVILFNVSNEE